MSHQQPEAKLLVVDDEPNIRELLSTSLRFAGFDVTAAANGREALAAVERDEPDLAVLDVMLPDMDGFTVTRKLRAAGRHFPVVFLTARDDTDDKVTGLTVGGDDYVTKPFSLEEVLLRLHRLVQRSGAATADESELVVGDLVLNVDSREVTRSGDDVQLTATEFDLLRYLMENARRVVSKPQILDAVWNYDFGGQANIVELYVSYLRKKIDVGRDPMIHTVRGAGYVLKPAA